MQKHYLIDGVGPDNFDDIKSGCFSVGCSNTNERTLAIVYESSNGLRSKGDIFKIWQQVPPGFNDLFR